MSGMRRIVPTSRAGVPVDEVPTVARIRRSTQAALWVLLVMIELFNATLLALLATSYFTSRRRNSLLWVASLHFLFAEGYEFVDRHSTVIATAYAVLSIIFLTLAGRLIWLSLRTRELRFGKLESIVPVESRRSLQLKGPAASQSWPVAISHLVSRKCDKALFSIGFHGQYFELRLLADEIFEIASQTIAAYSSSRSISNIYLNQTFGFVIFLNSTSALVFHKICRRSRVRQRIACLLTDLILDFVWGTLLPVWMYQPILDVYYRRLQGPVIDSESYTRMFERVLILSWPNFILSIVPFMNSLLNFFEIQSIMREIESPVTASLVLKRRSTILRTQPSHANFTDVLPVAYNKWVSRFAKIAHVVIAMYGCAVLFISLSANEVFRSVIRQPHFSCAFRVHPWFSTKEACVRRRVNCSVVGIDGTATELEDAFQHFDENSLVDLQITDCPALIIPRAISRFHSLSTLSIAKSQIVDWPLEAALKQQSFSSLRTVKLLEVETNSTLDGFVSTPISSVVEYIRIADVLGAATLLDSVGSNWGRVKYFDCDRCNLSEVPRFINHMEDLLALSLTGNDIVDFRDDFISEMGLQLIGIWLDSNPRLTTLSDTVWRQGATCDMFNVQESNMSAVPEWLPNIAHAEFVIYAYGTPLCNAKLGVGDVRPRRVCHLCVWYTTVQCQPWASS